MTPTIITLIVLAVVIIVASCFIGMGETKESENIEIKDIPEDKKQKIDAMVDDYFGKAVGKKSGNLISSAQSLSRSIRRLRMISAE